MKFSVFALLAISMLVLSGCGGAKPAPTQKQVKVKQGYEHYKVGKTTKDEIIADLGEPSGRAYNSKGEETFAYHNIHATGKAWIPFYFGHDRVRTSIQNFTFNKKNILINYSTSSNHY